MTRNGSVTGSVTGGATDSLSGPLNGPLSARATGGKKGFRGQLAQSRQTLEIGRKLGRQRRSGRGAHQFDEPELPLLVDQILLRA